MAIERQGLSNLVLTEGMDMRRHSSFSTGGKAEYYAEPRSVFDCLIALETAYRKNLSITVIGAGTHVLVSDSGIPGLVISTASMRGMSIKGNLLIASAGETLDNIINIAIEHNLTGLEEIAGVGPQSGFMRGNDYRARRAVESGYPLSRFPAIRRILAQVRVGAGDDIRVDLVLAHGLAQRFDTLRNIHFHG